MAKKRYNSTDNRYRKSHSHYSHEIHAEKRSTSRGRRLGYPGRSSVLGGRSLDETSFLRGIMPPNKRVNVEKIVAGAVPCKTIEPDKRSANIPGIKKGKRVSSYRRYAFGERKLRSYRRLQVRQERRSSGTLALRSMVPTFSHMSIEKHYVPVFTPQEVLKAYEESERFRRMIDCGAYIYADGIFVLRSKECIRIKQNKAKVRSDVFRHPEFYCIHFTKRLDLTYLTEDQIKAKKAEPVTVKIPIRRDRLNELKDAEKINDVIIQSFKKLLGDNEEPPYTFAEALKYHMHKNNMTNAELAEIIDTTPETISKYRSGSMLPKRAIVVAMCVVFSLDPYRGEQLLQLAGYYLNNTPICRIYRAILGLAAYITLEEANTWLEELGLKPLTVERTLI